MDPHRSETLDLFERCSPPETLDASDFRALDDGDNNIPSDYSGLDMGVGLGFGFDIHDHEEDGEEEDLDHAMDHGGCLRVAWTGSDSYSEPDLIPEDQDASLQLRWDSLRLGDGRRDDDYEFEWEEMNASVNERKIFSMMAGEGLRSSEGDGEEEDDGQMRRVDWEALMAVNNSLVEVDEEGDFIVPLEYEFLFGQFADTVRGSPPAAKSVVSSLPSVVLTQEDVAKNNTLCAVCKDEISVEEKAKRLPCMHHYHSDCILPWLGIRNTCPVCRYELPADDPDYESWKAQRRASGENRYVFESFSALQ